MVEIEKKVNLIKATIKEASLNEEISSLAKETIGSPDLSGIVKAYDFVKDRVKFEEEPFGEDNYQHPLLTLKLGSGDCEDHTMLLGSLLKAQGYQVGVKFVPRGGNNYHVYPVVETPEGRLPLDTTIKEPIGSEVKARWSKIYPV